MIAQNRRHGVYTYAQLGIGVDSVPPRLRPPGLDPDLVYTVSPCSETTSPMAGADQHGLWLDSRELRLSGKALATVGLTAPLLNPAQAIVFEVRTDEGELD